MLDTGCVAALLGLALKRLQTSQNKTPASPNSTSRQPNNRKLSNESGILGDELSTLRSHVPAACVNGGSNAVLSAKFMQFEQDFGKRKLFFYVRLSHCNIPNCSQAATKLPGRSADILVRSKPERIKNSRSSVSQRVNVDCCGQECPRSGLGCGFAALQCNISESIIFAKILADELGLLSPNPSPPEEERGAALRARENFRTRRNAEAHSLSSFGGEGRGEEASETLNPNFGCGSAALGLCGLVGHPV